MADAAARQLQYEYKAVRFEIEMNFKSLQHFNLKRFHSFFLFIFYRIQIWFYKPMFDLLKDLEEMRQPEKCSRLLESYKAPKWEIELYALSQKKLKSEKLSKLIFKCSN